MTKRRAEGGVEAAYASPSQQQQSSSSSAPPFAKRSPGERATRTAASDAAAPIELARQVDIRAYGLEDRAEAVIAMGKSNWTLANLSKWRDDSLASTNGGSASSDPGIEQQQQSSKEYLRQRQRAYMKQRLAANKAPANYQ
ncbi:hypothetical protein Gpo141_00007509 [Globisporangium polare]